MIIAMLFVIRFSELQSPAFPITSRGSHMSTSIVFLFQGIAIHNHGASFSGTCLTHSFLSVHSTNNGEN